jgi:hypothetical protein
LRAQPVSLRQSDDRLRFAISMNVPPPLDTVPPLPPLSPPPKSGSSQTTLAILLSLYVGLFLADAVVSLADDTLALIFKHHPLSILRQPLGFLVVVASIGIYILMGLTPKIPKRLFLPMALFVPLAFLAGVPATIYHYRSLALFAWLVSLVQVVTGVAVLFRAQGGLRLRWPLVAESRLKSRGFSWRNLIVFFLVNLLILMPGAVIYLLIFASLGISHFSDGFVALRAHGLTVQARKYVRDDGKTVQLVPMAHVAERSFYRALSDSFTSNSIVLLEGVTDEQGLLTNHITYKRMAQTLGVAEQQKEFKPAQGELVPADVDVADFTTNTIGFLNLIMQVHAHGLRPDILMQLVQFAPQPGFEQELLTDLLHKRNLHVVEELQSRLDESEQFVVPWGAAHMPGIAKELQKLGFRVNETRDFTVIRFRSSGKAREASK